MLNIECSIENEAIERRSSIDERLCGDREVEGSIPGLGDFLFSFPLGILGLIANLFACPGPPREMKLHSPIISPLPSILHKKLQDTIM